MAMTLASVTAVPAGGGQVRVIGQATASADYDPTTGEVIDLSSYINAGAGIANGFTVLINSDDGYHAQHDRGNATAGAITFWEAGADGAALDAVAASTNLAAVVCTFIAYGPAPLS